MENKLFIEMVRAVVLTAYDQAASDFRVNPTGDCWKNLEDAMWARQALTSAMTMKKAVEVLEPIGVGRWIKTLRELHEQQ